jgi:secretion/DNA translocation related CpaE-like protein
MDHASLPDGPPTSATGDRWSRPLVVCGNDDVSDDVLRLAAAAGVEVTHARDPDSRSAWRSATLVVIDANLVRAAVLAGMPRRSGVIAVAPAEPEPAVWEHCVMLGVERTVLLPAGEATLVELLTDAGGASPGDGRLITVIGARGGAGASLLAAAVAVAGLRQGLGVLLADCDRWGAGQDIMLGLEADTGLRWHELAASASAGRLPLGALHDALPSIVDRSVGPRPVRSPSAVLSVVSHGRGETPEPSVEALEGMLTASRRAGELVVADVPRTPAAVGDRAVENADLVVLVAGADVASCYAGRRVSDRVQALTPHAVVLVRGPAPGGLDGKEVAAALGLPLLATMRPQPHVSRDLELGRAPGLDPRSPLGRAAAAVLRAAGVRR